MRKLLVILSALSLISCKSNAQTNTFNSNLELKSPTTSPNIILHECDINTPGCTDTYANIMWYGSDGHPNYFMSAHLIKGSTGEVHRHHMERFSCGTDESDIVSCGRIETDIDSDFPTREFRNMNVYINPGSIYMKSPDGNKWKLSISNGGELQITDENPPAQPVTTE